MSAAAFPPQRSASPCAIDWIDGQHDVIRKLMFEQRGNQRRATPEDKVGAILRLDPANALDDVRSKALERAHSRLSGRWVATYFLAALRPSAIGLLGAFRQKVDQIS